MAGLHFDITGDNTNLMEKLKEVERGVKSASASVEKEGGSIEQLFSRMSKAAAAFGAGFTAKELIQNIVQVRGEFQQLEVAFTTMLGSQEKAASLMSQLTETAAKTPFDLQGVANGARQLLAYGTAVEDVNETLVRLGNIAAGLSIPLNDLVYLYGTTMTQGRLYTQDLNQFTGRGIPMIKELAKEFGVAESEIKSMVEAGKIGFPEVQKVIQNLTDEGGMFYNLMQEQSKTITGQISNIGDSFSMMLNEIGKANEGIINDALGGVSYLIENYETVGKVLLEIVGTYGAYRAALITITALQKAYSAILAQSALNQSLAAASGVTLSNAQALAATRTKLLQMAQAALNKTLLANPYVAAAAAVASLGLGIYKLVTYQTEAEKAQERLNESVAESEKASLSEQRELSKLKGELSALKEGTDEYNTVKEKIIAGYSKYYDGLEEEINKVGLTEEAYKRLTDAITQSYGARQYQQFKSQQESELDAVMSENLGKIQERLIDKLGEEAGSRYYAKIRDAIMQGNLTAINGTANISGLDRDTDKALDKAASVGFGIENRAIESYIATILNAIRLTDELDKKARQKFGVTGIRSESQSSQAPFSAEGKSISQLEEEIGKAQTKLESLKKAFADGSGTKEAVSEQEAYIKSLQDTVLEREKDLKVINEVKTQISKLEKDQGETVSGSEEYNALQSRIDALRTKLPKTKSDKAAEDKQAKEQKETEQKLSDELLELQRENQERETAIMEEGKAKKLKQIDDDYEARKAEIKKKSRELAELNKKAGISGTNGNGLTAEQQKEIDHASELNDENKIKQSNEVYKAEREAMNRYLQEYGTFQQKRLAITEEYNQKIQKALSENNMGEALAFTQERNRLLSSLDKEKAFEGIEKAFGNISNLSGKAIDSLIDNLKKYKKEAIDTFDVSDIDRYEKALSRLEDAKLENKFSVFSNFIPDFYREQIKLEEEFNQAQETSIELGQKQAELEKEILEYIEKQTGKKFKKEDLYSTEGINGITGLLSGKGGDSLSKFTEMKASLDSVSAASENAGQNVSALFNMKGGSGGGASTVAVIDTIVHGINDLVQGLNDMANEIKDTMEALGRNTDIDSGIGKFAEGMSMFAEASQGATDAWDSLKSGNIGGVFAGVTKSFTAWIKGFAGIHDKKNEKRIQQLQEQVDTLTDSYDKLDRAVEDAYSKDASGLIEDQNKLLEQQKLLIEQQIREEQDKKNTDDERIKEWQRQIEEINQTIEDNKEAAVDAIFGEDLQSAIENFADAYAEAWANGEDKAESAKDTVKKMMQQMVTESIKAAIQSSGAMEDIRNKLQQFYADNVLTGWEQDYIYNMAEELQKELDEQFGWADSLFGSDKAKEQQSASSGGYETMTQDQASELNGRFTALYEVGLQIYNTLLLMQTITVSVNEQNSVLFEIRNLIISSNGYLEDMSGLQKKIYELLNASIPQISNQLNKL